MSWNFQVYVIHYTKFIDRKRYLDSRLEEIPHASIEWCNEEMIAKSGKLSYLSKQIFGRSLVSCGMDLGISARSLVKSRRRAWLEAHILFARYLIVRRRQLVMGSLPDPNSRLREIDLDVQQMHVLALRQGIQSDKNWILVLEDDSIFDSDAFLQTEQILRNFEWQKPIWVSLGDGAGLKRTSSDRFLRKSDLFRVKPPAVRCSSAYLVSRTFVEKFLNLVDLWGLPDWLPIDYIFHLSMKRIPRVKTYWKDSPIFFQGSESGNYKSGLREK